MRYLLGGEGVALLKCWTVLNAFLHNVTLITGSVGQKVPVFWEDEQVVIYDSFARFHSYTYFAIIDLDEYLVPKRHEDFKDMMVNLQVVHEKKHHMRSNC